MPLNTILAIAESVGINDQRFVGQMLSRNQRLSTSEILTVQPFSFDIKPMNYLLYSQNRTLLSELRVADKSIEQFLNFGSTGWLNYIKYQGDMTSPQILACAWQSSSANKVLVLGSLPSISSSSYIVRTGDFCQVDRYTYIATADVQRGSGTTVNIPVHRSLITTVATTSPCVIGQYGTTINLGGATFTGVTFPVVLKEYPTYNLIPMTNDSFINWQGTFRAFELVL
ncbi:hypothetical protein UFOVP263_46 [uncultured Caudovirales phage]|uniref:Uncharacterized protein n=1 Tax=uncultured Caudovirales phage TaxID=2100421 RepID=A0A6J5LLN8_9CAUD|nr:hypothetical protein UFOVP263_46 [uncultured Caudovirales phage]CAB4242013.1 hypothetical protein UFOVP91_16 [uncultured Caudovirales phage]